MKRPAKNTKSDIIRAVTSPLGFFVLALLIVETFIGSVLVWGKLDATTQALGMWMACGLFIFVVIVVALLAYKKPEHLIYDKEAMLMDKGRGPFGSNEGSMKAEARFDVPKKEGQ